MQLEAPFFSCDNASASTEDFHNGMLCFLAISIVMNKKRVARSQDMMGPMSHRKLICITVSKTQAAPIAVMFSLIPVLSLSKDVKSVT